jgi:DNA-binding transcriptional MocR family regulator
MTLPKLSFDRTNGEPLYGQLVSALGSAMETGGLKDGERLPSERDLAEQLGLSRTTVVNAYRELESRGLVRSHVGRGTFVCASAETIDAPFAWRGKVAVGADLGALPSTRNLMRDSSNPNLISFAVLSPAFECFPINDYRRVTDQIIKHHATAALGLAPTEGQPLLRAEIARRLGVKTEQILIVSGAQQGLDLVARCLLDPGDAVIIDRPGYFGAIHNFRAAGAKLIGWDAIRSDLGELEDLILRYRPKLICTNPTFQNPTGRTLPIKEREQLLALTARYRVPIIEDDPFRDTYLGAPPPPTLYQLDQSNIVIYVSTFSKTLAPGLRLGWLTASEYVVDQLASIKQRANLFTEGLGQLVLAEFLKGGTYDEHLLNLREEHAERRSAMKKALEQSMPPRSLDFSCPLGGLHFWCRLNKGVESQQLLRLAVSRGVAFASGEMFYADDGAGRREFRLCFTSVPAPRIEEGIKLLAEAVDAGKSDRSQREDFPVPLV